MLVFQQRISFLAAGSCLQDLLNVLPAILKGSLLIVQSFLQLRDILLQSVRFGSELLVYIHDRDSNKPAIPCLSVLLQATADLVGYDSTYILPTPS